MTNYIFTTPYVKEGPIGGHRLFYFYKRNVGLSVVKVNGTWTTVRYVQDSYFNQVDEAFRGGREHVVTEAKKNELIAANIGITETNFKQI